MDWFICGPPEDPVQFNVFERDGTFLFSYDSSTMVLSEVKYPNCLIECVRIACMYYLCWSIGNISIGFVLQFLPRLCALYFVL